MSRGEGVPRVRTVVRASGGMDGHAKWLRGMPVLRRRGRIRVGYHFVVSWSRVEY